MAPLDHPLARPQARDVHAQRPAEDDVQQLGPATGCEQGLVRCKDGAQQGHLEGVTLRAERGSVIGALVAPEGGAHVRAARHGDAVRERP